MYVKSDQGNVTLWYKVMMAMSVQAIDQSNVSLWYKETLAMPVQRGYDNAKLWCKVITTMHVFVKPPL